MASLSLSPDIGSLVQGWIQQGGIPRRFEQGVSSHFEYLAPYLRQYGIVVRMNGWRCEVSHNGGPWRLVKRPYVLALVDQLRAAEGLEPIRAVRS